MVNARRTAVNPFGRMGKKLVPGRCPERQLIAQRPSMINQAREVFCQARFPASLIYALIVSPSPAVPSTLCRFPLVILQQAAQSFSTPHCSRVPSCLRLQRKQDPIAFALMVPLFMVMQQILLQGSPQRSLAAGVIGPLGPVEIMARSRRSSSRGESARRSRATAITRIATFR
jgi:hypothetical protein